ncbi:MAG: restriction endonuclease [Saprospiraceae bacterium]
MPVPDYQTLMLPLLKFAADGKEHTQAEAISALAKEFKLTAEELAETVPSGQQTTFENRVNWSKTYLKKAGLLEYPRRAFFKITGAGQEALRQNPPKINVAFLKQYAGFLDFVEAAKPDVVKSNRPETTEETSTPEEVLEKGYRSIRKAVASDLLEKVIAMSTSPAKFEKLVVDLLVSMGYGGNIKEAGKHLGKSGDGGIDGVIQEDQLGLDMIYVQAKCWKPENTVNRPEIDKFIGALARRGAKKGVFITTSSFARGVRESESRSDIKVVLIDGRELVDLMIDHNVGVTVKDVYTIKRLDIGYFEEE